MQVTIAHLRLQGMMILLLVSSIGLEVHGNPLPMQLVGEVDTGTDSMTAAKSFELGKDLTKFENTSPSRTGTSSVKKEAGEDLSSTASDLQNKHLNDAGTAGTLERLHTSGSRNSGLEVAAGITKAEKDKSGQTHTESTEELMQRIKLDLQEVTANWGAVQRQIVDKKRKASKPPTEGESLAAKRPKGESDVVWQEVQRMKLKALILTLIKQYNRNFPRDKMEITALELIRSAKDEIRQFKGRLSNLEREWLTSRLFGGIKIVESKKLDSSTMRSSIEGQSSEDTVKQLEARSKEMLMIIVRKRAQSRILGWVLTYNKKYGKNYVSYINQKMTTTI